MAESISPRLQEFEAVYFDGERPLPQPAQLQLQSGYAEITTDSAQIRWPLDEIRVASDGRFGEPVRLERSTGALGAYLAVDDASVVETLRERHASSIPADFLIGELRGWPAVVVVSLVIVGIGYGIFSWVAPVLAEGVASVAPPAVEARLGRAVSNLIAPAASRCNHEEREELMQRIVARLAEAAGGPYEFRVISASNPMPNALAAPGGYIVVFDGLLQHTETPEELAGILAHEITHVLKRHSTRALARDISSRTLLNLMTMDSAGTPTAMQGAVNLNQLAYQRADEDEADLGAVEILARAHIRPEALSAFFRRLQVQPLIGGTSSSYFSSHPALLERAQRIDAASSNLEVQPVPLLSAEEWQRMRSSCIDATLPPPGQAQPAP